METLTIIGTLIGILLGISAPIIKLTTTITKLDMTIGNVLGVQADHEIRIKKLEGEENENVD